MGIDLWTAPLPSTLAWQEVDEFLQPQHREGPRLEYRSRYSGPDQPDPSSRKRPHGRFPDTVGAMANSGGGLIFYGVETDLQDRPTRWPTLDPGSLKAQTLEGDVRNYLDPYIPLEIAVAELRSVERAGDVLVVRVPDVVTKPVFVDQRGVLIREGEASVPARLSAIREWLVGDADRLGQVAADFAHYISGSIRPDRPVLNIGVYPRFGWLAHRWDDASDAALTALVSGAYRDVPHRTISDDLVGFRHQPEPTGTSRWVWFRPSGAMLRRVDLDADADGRLSALRIAAEVRRAWELARATTQALLPGYSGPLQFGLALGAVTAGFASVGSMQFRFEELPFRSRDQLQAWARWWELPIAVATDEVVEIVIARLLRAFGYSGIGPGIQELVLRSNFPDAMA